ncbi:MAG: MCE family protein [Gemmataceae bacterium]|nr:MCE family protein [Gemmataceae bacterium]
MGRELSQKQAIQLALICLVGIGLGLAGLFAIGSKSWLGSKALNLQAGFVEIRGIETGTRVRVQGMDAGQITRISPPREPGQPVILDMKVREEFRDLIRQDATVRIVPEGLLGGKVIEIHPGSPGAPLAPDHASLKPALSPDLSDLISQASDSLEAIRKGNGSLGKLIHDQKLYDDLVLLARQSLRTMVSVQQDADAFKEIPFFRDYVADQIRILIHSNRERKRMTVPSAELFEKGTSILTKEGKSKLDEVGKWFLGHPKEGEIVIAAFANPADFPPETVGIITRQQSEAVSEYLLSQHKIHKTGWIPWYSERKVKPLGAGATGVPGLEAPPGTPLSRLEFLLFLTPSPEARSTSQS